MWVKTTCYNLFLSSFNKKLLLQCTGAVLYQHAGYNLQRATTLLAFVLADPFTSTQVPTYRMLLYSFSSCQWKGATTPLALVLADMFTSTQVPAYDLPGTTFHTFSYWIHEIITIVEQPASSISESPNTESLKPCQQQPDNITTTRSNSIFKYHTSHCIRYFDEPNLRVYALLPKPTRVQICKF